jgi:acetylornithine deacetylase/succinyl-diaminopimelate desuccinylase-like protein
MNSAEAVTVDREALINDLANMIRIPSVNRFGEDDHLHPAEAAMANYFEKRLTELGLETSSRDISSGRRNVWGRLKGSGNGPTVLLAGHLDTVGVTGYDNAFEPKLKDGRIFGRGSCDMKAGFAAYLEVARILINSGKELSGDLIITGVVDEEHAMTGSQDFGINGPHVDYATVAEPTSLAICPAHKGQICMTIKTYGLAAHSSVPENGTNAIYHMAEFCRRCRIMPTASHSG